MAAFAERRRISISWLPPEKREAVEEMLDGAIDALLSFASALTTTSGIPDAAVAENCVDNKQWTPGILMRAIARAGMRARARTGARQERERVSVSVRIKLTASCSF